MNVYTIAIAMCLVLQTRAESLMEHFENVRNTLIEDELSKSLGRNVALNAEESRANEIIMNLKRKEVDAKYKDPQPEVFWDRAEKSQVFKIIRKMPKGGALHVHDSFMLDVASMIALAYEFKDHLYACYHNDIKLLYSKDVPSGPCPVPWALLSELRNTSGNIEAFDEGLKKHFILIRSVEKGPYENINHVWDQFEKVHSLIQSLISFRPAREKYFYRSLERFYEDNVKYIEIRSGLHALHELNGTVHEEIYIAQLYKAISERFIKTHPDFIGFKFIVTASRSASNEKVWQRLEYARNLSEEMPDIVAGFDLVGQEDKGRPLKDFFYELNSISRYLNYYFHGGETNWFGTPSDENLFDAVLLEAKRIGHAYALLKHPSLIKTVKELDIAIEVNVISNAVLSLLLDVRNHPLAAFLAMGLPVVLSSDDSSAFMTRPLSHDFFVAFISVGSRHYDLRMLKQLVYNSIKYSALDTTDKNKFIKTFNKDWTKFIKDVNSGQY